MESNLSSEKSLTSGIIFTKCIVAFLDILGYKDFVLKAQKDTSKIKKMEDALESSLNSINKIYNKLSIESLEQIRDSIKIKVLSDSIIITMPLNSNIIINGTKINEMLLIDIFMITLSVLAHNLILSSGHLLRGAVTIGNHYDSVITNQKHLFVFSPALIRAFQLENEACYPRIIIDNEAYDYINTIKVEEDSKKTFYIIDIKGVRCLNIFNENIWSDTEIFKLLFQNLKSQIVQYRNNQKILDKYFYFIDCLIQEFKKSDKINPNVIVLEGLKRDLF